MREELYTEMYVLEERHWWFAARRAIVSDLLPRYLRPPPSGRPAVADLGCGCGLLTQALGTRYNFDCVGMDASEHSVRLCARRGLRVERGFLPGSVPLPRDRFDAVLMLDVLEHLDEDRESAAVAASLLRVGGILVCTVPAYKWLWSPRDVHHEHRRRYSAQEFRRLFELPNLKIELFSHMNSFLFPFAAAARLWARFRKHDASRDLHVPPEPLNTALRAVFSSERKLLPRFRLPFGLSLIAVARRVEPDAPRTVS
ncbi:MAG: class I SAM-dependent methyltransferase [Tepidisphaeraceae bacterium]|jgi:SAM-dependent methyltransferase